ncbi:MAG: copper transporter [Jatrophihabitantaceae bacterium]
MISFRYHIVSLVAVILALAVGIVVGTTALNGPVTKDLRHQVDGLKKDRADLADQLKSLQGQVDTAGQFATTFGAQLVAGTLTDDKVLIVSLPGTSTGMVDGIANQLSAAGAKITGRLELANSYIDPAQADSIQGLATSTGGARPFDLTLPVTSDARVLAAAMLAFVLTGHGQATDIKAVLGSFSGLHMIASDPAGIEPATNVVVLGNGAQPKDDYAGVAEFDLVSQLTQKNAKVVVAGDTGSAQANGVVGLARDGTTKSSVSTIDNANTAFGQVSTALAMAGALHSQLGHYGTGKGAQALFPTTTK